MTCPTRFAFQSTLPTRGSDPLLSPLLLSLIKVSIHAPHEGERLTAKSRTAKAASCFNPRSPRGGATFATSCCISGRRVSIHAPHEGERLLLLIGHWYANRVSIHAPHEGERRTNSALCCSMLLFQSTLPTRGSDAGYHRQSPLRREFQSTLPTRGSDLIL